MKKIVLFLIVTLFAVMLIACSSDKNKEDDVPSTGADVNIVLPENDKKENEILGKEGNIKLTLLVTHKDDSRVMYNVETTKDNLGDALLEGSIIKCDGSTVTEVDGEASEAGKACWSFYKNGETLVADIFSASIAEGDSFEARYIK